MFIVLVNLFQLLEDLLIELILNELSPDNGIGFYILIFLNILSDPHNLRGFNVKLLLLLLFLCGFLLAFCVDGVDCEEDLPEDTLNEGRDDVDYGDVEEAEEEHYDDEVLWGSPAVVEGYLRPSSLSEDLNQYVLSIYEALEVAELLVLIVVYAPRHVVNIVKNLNADDGVNIEEEDEERHESEYNRHDLKYSLEDIRQFRVHLNVHLLL